MKIREIISEAPATTSAQGTLPGMKLPRTKTAPKKSPVKTTTTTTSVAQKPTIGQTIKNIPGNIQSYLSKDDNFSKFATDISTIGGGPGIKDYSNVDKKDDAKFQDLLNILKHPSLKKAVDPNKITTAMTNMYQSDKQLPTDRQYFINAVKSLNTTHPKIKTQDLYKEYEPIFKRYQINPNELA